MVAFCISGVVDCLVSNTASTYQYKLGYNSVGIRPLIIASSRLQRGRIVLHMSDTSREDEIRKKVRLYVVVITAFGLINSVYILY